MQLLSVASDPEWLRRIHAGYADDRWCSRLLHAVAPSDPDPLAALHVHRLDGLSVAGVCVRDGLLFAGEHLCIPRVPELREALFRLAHDNSGHFGSEKSYALLHPSYYWPWMCRNLEQLYVPGCDKCQRNKSSTHRPHGPLQSLPVPDGCFHSVGINFIGLLPEDDGSNCIATVTCRLGADIRLIPCHTDTSAEDFAALFFEHKYCKNGLPLDIVSDRDTQFISRFWKALHWLAGVNLRMSTSFHPETDGASERTNKTVIQMLRYHLARNQTGWRRTLPLIRFQLMNSEHASMGSVPFQLCLGLCPRIIPLLVNSSADTICSQFGPDSDNAQALLLQIETDTIEAQDNLLLAKTQQALAANAHCRPELAYKVGDHVLLSTFHRHRNYMQHGDHRVTKFMVRYDGPYIISAVHPSSSTYTLDLPTTMYIHPTFHASLPRPYVPNEDSLFPGRADPKPGPVVTADSVEEFFVERILHRWRRGCGWQYLMCWRGYGPGSDSWLPGSEVDELEALNILLHEQGLTA